MKQIHEYERDIASIRNIMEKSVKFLSLSGLSGVLAGVYALIGATTAYFVVQYPLSPMEYRQVPITQPDILWKLLLIAGIVLAASLFTGVWLSGKQAKKQGVKLWNAAGKRLITNLAIPLVTGGLFTLIVLFNEHYGLVAPTMLIFYGIALIQASGDTYDDIRYLGFCEIFLGLVAALFPGFGLIFWSVGFGVLHIVYGAIMFKKYDQ